MEHKSAFFNLPAELRNRIYEFVLLQEDDEAIEIGSTGVPEPSLLLTCKQIRKEGLPIYYEENTFDIFSRDFDSSVMLKWAERSRLVTTEEALASGNNHVRSSSMQPNWLNLSLWLERYHKKEVHDCIYHPTKAPAHFSADLRVVGVMFCLVLSLRDRPWSGVKQLLDEDHNILVSLDSRWK